MEACTQRVLVASVFLLFPLASPDKAAKSASERLAGQVKSIGFINFSLILCGIDMIYWTLARRNFPEHLASASMN